MPCACGLLSEMIDCLPQPETMAAPPTTMTATAYLALEARRGRCGGGFTKYAVFRGKGWAGALYPALRRPSLLTKRASHQPDMSYADDSRG